MVNGDAEGDQAADLSTGRFDLPPPRFDPLPAIDPRRLVEIYCGAPDISRETAELPVVHPSRRRRVDLSRFALYLLPIVRCADQTDGVAAAIRDAYITTLFGDPKHSDISYSSKA
jgi:hypothetical protein